jgi:molybdate transport system substrate-binding protein
MCKSFSIFILLSLAGGIILARTAAVQTRPEIRVAAASDLMRAFRAIAPRFEEEFGCKVTLIFGSSGLLAKQSENGAPFDLFAAANESYVRDLESKRKILPGTRQIYALGRIVIWTAPGKKRANTLRDLTDGGFRRIAIANPRHAPYGQAAKEALTRYGLWTQIKPKLVYGENVTQALQYAESGAADAAIVALSLAIDGKGSYTLVPESLHSPLRQALGVLSRSANPDLAKRFAEFVGRPQGRWYMKRYGFRLPGER